LRLSCFCCCCSAAAAAIGASSFADVPSGGGAGSRQGQTGDRFAAPRPTRRATGFGAATDPERNIVNEREPPSADDLEERIDLPDRPEGSFEGATTVEEGLDLSIEEAAVRARRNAPGGTEDASDGYVEGKTT
jgi:hypothetical protein